MIQPSMKNAQVVQYFDTLIDFYGGTFYGWNIEERRLCKGSFTNYIYKFLPYLTTLPTRTLGSDLKGTL